MDQRELTLLCRVAQALAKKQRRSEAGDEHQKTQASLESVLANAARRSAPWQRGSTEDTAMKTLFVRLIANQPLPFRMLDYPEVPWSYLCLSFCAGVRVECYLCSCYLCICCASAHCSVFRFA